MVRMLDRPNLSCLSHQGPRSYLSICSTPGVRWVSENTGSSLFGEVAKHFTETLTQILKIRRNLSTTKQEEPEPALAWKYSQGSYALQRLASHTLTLDQLISTKPPRLHSKLSSALDSGLGYKPISTEHPTMIQLGTHLETPSMRLAADLSCRKHTVSPKHTAQHGASSRMPFPHIQRFCTSGHRSWVCRHWPSW